MTTDQRRALAQSLLDELGEKLAESKDNTKMLEGAVQGVNILFQRLNDAELSEEQGPADESDSKPHSGKKTKKSK